MLPCDEGPSGLLGPFVIAALPSHSNLRGSLCLGELGLEPLGFGLVCRDFRGETTVAGGIEIGAGGFGAEERVAKHLRGLVGFLARTKGVEPNAAFIEGTLRGLPRSIEL